MFTVVVIVAVIIIIFVVIGKKKGPEITATVFIGRDSKGRPVYEQRYSNGTRSMMKIIENGRIEMNIRDFNADSGQSCFMPSENLRRYLVALEKGLVQAKDNDGKLETGGDGLIRYKDSNGNYVDNPDNYYP